jgi:Co/Zn/Cd efflux system component
MGIVGAFLVAAWARGLLADTGKILLDREMDHPVVDEIREAVAAHTGADYLRILDLHVWRVGRHVYSCALSLSTDNPAVTPAEVREWLAIHPEIAHVTVEIHQK